MLLAATGSVYAASLLNSGGADGAFHTAASLAVGVQGPLQGWCAVGCCRAPTCVSIACVVVHTYACLAC